MSVTLVFIYRVAGSIHNSTLFSFVGFTTVLFSALSDSQQYSFQLCPIHSSTLFSFVGFTTVLFSALSDSQQYSFQLCPIHNSTNFSFVGLKMEASIIFSLKMNYFYVWFLYTHFWSCKGLKGTVESWTCPYFLIWGHLKL